MAVVALSSKNLVVRTKRFFLNFFWQFQRHKKNNVKLTSIQMEKVFNGKIRIRKSVLRTRTKNGPRLKFGRQCLWQKHTRNKKKT